METLPVSLPYGEVQQVLSSGRLQVLDGADSVETLLEEELGRLHGTRTGARVHGVQTVDLLPAWQLKHKTITGSGLLTPTVTF